MPPTQVRSRGDAAGSADQRPSEAGRGRAAGASASDVQTLPVARMALLQAVMAAAVMPEQQAKKLLLDMTGNSSGARRTVCRGRGSPGSGPPCLAHGPALGCKDGEWSRRAHQGCCSL
eukprot:366578-Chlamydomonas_euryale.AAC.6